MSNRYLVPLDGRKTAEAALDSVKKLASPDDAIVLLMVERPAHQTRSGAGPGAYIDHSEIATVGTGSAGSAGPDLPRFVETEGQALQRELDEATDYLEELASGLRDSGHSVDVKVELGKDAADAIIEYARHAAPDIIAMLAKDRRHLLPGTLSGVTSAVVEAGIAPVLIVPQPEA
jgi:nucleotide-binding universal stress UspA family protein